MRRAGLLALLALTLSAPFWGLGHAAWEVDDARYLEIPREMAASGDWLTPTLDTLPYVEKPPLIYWLSAASYKAFGVSEAAGRLPLALVSLAGLLGTLWLGTWLYSARVGIAAVVLLGTCLEFLALSHMLTPDMALSVTLLWATGLALRCLRRPEDSAWAGPLAWLALGLAFLSKGLVAPLLFCFWVAALAALFPDLRRGLRPLFLNWGLPLAAAAVAAWLAAMEAANPGFLRFFFLEQQFSRFLTSQYNRPGPPYYYVAIELAGTLPWTPLALAGALLPALRWRSTDERDRQLLLWVAGVFAFFSISNSKLPTYILPLFPQQALLAARILGRLREGDTARRWVRNASQTLAVPILALCLAAPFAATRSGLAASDPRWLSLAAVGTLACLGSALALLGLAGRPRGDRAFLRAGALALGMQACLLLGALVLRDQLSVKSLGLRIRALAEGYERRGVGVRLLVDDVFIHGLPFYARLPVQPVNWTGELHYARRFPRYRSWFLDERAISALPVPGQRAFLALPRSELAWAVGMSRPGAIRGMLDDKGPWVVLEY